MTADRIEGLPGRAVDDLHPKPFDPDELVARSAQTWCGARSVCCGGPPLRRCRIGQMARKITEIRSLLQLVVPRRRRLQLRH